MAIISKDFKRLGKSKIYKYVQHVQFGTNMLWRAELPQYKYVKVFDTERAAALAVDKKLIELKKEPINILKRI
jgi:hypothetical protein